MAEKIELPDFFKELHEDDKNRRRSIRTIDLLESECNADGDVKDLLYQILRNQSLIMAHLKINEPPKEEDLWTKALTLLKDKVSRPSYETWVAPTKAVLEGEKLIIITPNDFSKEWLQNHYKATIQEAVNQVSDTELELVFIVN